GVSNSTNEQHPFNNSTTQHPFNNTTCKSLFFGWLYTQCYKYAPYTLKNIYPYLDIKYLISNKNSVNECIIIIYELLKGIESKTVGVVMSKVKSIFLMVLNKGDSCYYKRGGSDIRLGKGSNGDSCYYNTSDNNTSYYNSTNNNTSYYKSTDNNTPLDNTTDNNTPLNKDSVSSLIIRFISLYNNNTPLQNTIYKIYIRVLEVYNIYKNIDCSYMLVIMGSIGIKGVRGSSMDDGGVKYSRDMLGGVNVKDSNIKGVNVKDSSYKGVNNTTNKQQGVNDLSDTLHPVNTTTNKQQGVNNIQYKHHPFNFTTTYNPLNHSNSPISLPKDCSINNTCKYLLENILLLQNYKEQDILFFVIQQTLKTMTDINVLEKGVINRIIHFKDTHYFIPSNDSRRGCYNSKESKCKDSRCYCKEIIKGCYNSNSKGSCNTDTKGCYRTHTKGCYYSNSKGSYNTDSKGSYNTDSNSKRCYCRDIAKIPFNNIIPNLLNIILSLLYNNTLYSYYNLLSYGTLLNPNISMFYTYIGIKVLYNSGLLKGNGGG
ncbi:hypothetical protein CWI39_2885p0010, partial [Hamiltosporidium magnivora]